MNLATLSGVLFVLAASTQTASADNVLVFGDHAGRSRIASTLSADGHTVAEVDALPLRLAGYDVIWHLGAVAALSDEEQKLLAGFVNAGGGLFLSGDGPGATAMNASVEQIANATTYKGGIELSEQPSVSGTHRFLSSARGFVAAQPNELYVWAPTVSGAIVNGPLAENVMTLDPSNRITSAAWAGPEMMNARGQLIVMMDSGWVSSPYSITRIVQNLEQFLINGVPATCGNLVAEEGETCDDGNFDDGDDCLTSCDVATCGDGFRMTSAEQCDDANAVSGDGCSAACNVEITPSDETNEPGDDPLEVDGVMTPDDPELGNDLAGGCSAGGGAGGGGLVLAAFAMVGLVVRRRR